MKKTGTGLTTSQKCRKNIILLNRSKVKRDFRDLKTKHNAGPEFSFSIKDNIGLVSLKTLFKSLLAFSFKCISI